MNAVAGQTESAGFTRRDLLVLVIAITLLTLLAFPAMIRAKRRAQRIACCGQLAQISLAFKQWSLDRANANPMNLSTNLGGTQEWSLLGEACRHFAAISNELNTPLCSPAQATRVENPREILHRLPTVTSAIGWQYRRRKHSRRLFWQATATCLAERA